MAGAVYSARKKIKATIITDIVGGQSVVSTEINNWIGSSSISGADLAKSLGDHLRSSGAEIDDGDLVVSVSNSDLGFKIETKNGKVFDARFIFFAAGSKRRKLGVPGENKFEGKGLAYCAICDAPLFKNKIVTVVGGGNAGLEAALDLSLYASKIYILEHKDALKADAETIERVQKDSKIEIITMAEVSEIVGKDFVESVRYKDERANEIKNLDVSGVFVEIGALPNSDLLKNLVDLDEYGEIIVDPKTQKTSNPAIWAAGDATNSLYKQNNIAVGDAIQAILNIADEISKTPQ